MKRRKSSPDDFQDALGFAATVSAHLQMCRGNSYFDFAAVIKYRRSHPGTLEAAIQKRQQSIEETPNYTPSPPWFASGVNDVLEKQISDVATSIEEVDAKLRSHARFEVVQKDLPDGSAACLTVHQVCCRACAIVSNPNSHWTEYCW